MLVKVGRSTRIRRNIEMFSANSQYDWLMKTLENSIRFDKSDPAKFRLHVLEHYYKYGWKSTINAFNIGKSTLYDWKRDFEKSKKKLISLVPRSTRPHNYRQSRVDYRLIEMIKSMREKRHNLSKYKLKPFVDSYAQYLEIETIGISNIGRIIKKKNIFFEISGTGRIKRKNKYSRVRTNKSPKVKKPGYIEVDCITIYLGNKKHYFVSIIDIFTKFAHVEKVATLSSKQAKLAFQKFQDKYELPIHTVQTDNGSEFLKYFHQYLEEQKLKHQFIYPRCPRVNGAVERFNRTVQEECINRSDIIYYDLNKFQEELVEYLNWYNYRRPHASLNYVSPVNFLKSNFPECG